MTMIAGTSYFISHFHARRYYADYEGLRYYDPACYELVDRKIAEGQIHLGMPPMKPGQRISRIDGGNRYALIG